MGGGGGVWKEADCLKAIACTVQYVYIQYSTYLPTYLRARAVHGGRRIAGCIYHCVWTRRGESRETCSNIWVCG